MRTSPFKVNESSGIPGPAPTEKHLKLSVLFMPKYATSDIFCHELTVRDRVGLSENVGKGNLSINTADH